MKASSLVLGFFIWFFASCMMGVAMAADVRPLPPLTTPKPTTVIVQPKPQSCISSCNQSGTVCTQTCM